MNTTLGKRIAALRREKGLKQDELAEKLSVSPQAVSTWENDQTCPDISLLPALAQILGVTVDELLTGKKEEAPSVKILPENEKIPTKFSAGVAFFSITIFIDFTGSNNIAMQYSQNINTNMPLKNVFQSPVVIAK